MTNSHKPLDHNQEAVRQDFTRLIETKPEAVAHIYVDRFGLFLSTRLACELSTNYSLSDETRGYYRPALIGAAQQIIDHLWQKILSNRSSKLPVLIIAGGGPGSGKHTTIFDPLLSLRNQILCAYDASPLPPPDLHQLINDAHQLNIPTILAYIQRPLHHAAYASIIRATREQSTPDPAGFAAQHFDNYRNFVSITKQYSKRKQLFVPRIIVNPGHPDDIHQTKPALSKHYHFTAHQAKQAYLTTLANLTHSATPPAFSPPKRDTRRRKREPRSTKTLAGTGTLISYLLAESLRTNLIRHEMTAAGTSSFQFNNLHPPNQDTPAPTHDLLHTRSFASKEDELDITATREQTLKGQEKALNNERPPRILVCETTTRNHEMETLLVR